MPRHDPRPAMIQFAEALHAAAETVTRADLKRAVATITKGIQTMNQELQTIINGFRAEVAETRDTLTAIKLVMTRKDDAYRAAIAAAEAKGATPEQLQDARDVLASFDETNTDLAAAALENTTAAPTETDAVPDPAPAELDQPAAPTA